MWRLFLHLAAKVLPGYKIWNGSNNCISYFITRNYPFDQNPVPFNHIYMVILHMASKYRTSHFPKENYRSWISLYCTHTESHTFGTDLAYYHFNLPFYICFIVKAMWSSPFAGKDCSLLPIGFLHPACSTSTQYQSCLFKRRHQRTQETSHSWKSWTMGLSGLLNVRCKPYFSVRPRKLVIHSLPVPPRARG